MDRLTAFEQMLEDIRRTAAYESQQMAKLKSEGKEKTATYRQYFGNRLSFLFLSICCYAVRNRK